MTVPLTTSETLKHKINPSADLAEPQTVQVLLYTPGTECFNSISPTRFPSSSLEPASQSQRREDRQASASEPHKSHRVHTVSRFTMRRLSCSLCFLRFSIYSLKSLWSLKSRGITVGEEDVWGFVRRSKGQAGQRRDVFSILSCSRE